MPTLARSHRFLLIAPLCAVALLGGCGRKGPLYLPPPPAASTAPVEPAVPAEPADAEPGLTPAAAEPAR